MFSARGGSGVVIAKLSDGSESTATSAVQLLDIPTVPDWSAPSAIGCGGFGAGCQIGAELTDFLIVLNSASVSRLYARSCPPSAHTDFHRQAVVSVLDMATLLSVA